MILESSSLKCKIWTTSTNSSPSNYHQTTRKSLTTSSLLIKRTCKHPSSSISQARYMQSTTTRSISLESRSRNNKLRIGKSIKNTFSLKAWRNRLKRYRVTWSTRYLERSFSSKLQKYMARAWISVNSISQMFWRHSIKTSALISISWTQQQRMAPNFGQRSSYNKIARTIPVHKETESIILVR